MGCSERAPEEVRLPLVRAEEPGYNRLERCSACHTDFYAKWRKSLHSVAMQVASDSTVLGDFTAHNVHDYAGVKTRMFVQDGRHVMETGGPDGKRRTYPIEYTIGVRQHQVFLTWFPGGRWQVLPVYYDGTADRWADAHEGGVLEGGRPPQPGDYYFWGNRGRAWNYHCFDCHASRVEKHYDVEADAYQTTVGSLAIDCEACHGPGEKHDVTRGQPGEPLHIADLRRFSADQSVEVCGQCHAAKQIVADGYLPGDPFYNFYTLALPDEVSAFWPDGQPRRYRYPMVFHLMGTCYRRGGLVCVNCHDSHGSDLPVDLVTEVEGVGLCEGCHAEIAANPVAHSHHAVGSTGNQCVTCHMPYLKVTGEHMTDHRILSPVPENTVRFGIPNACNQDGCHADKTAEWASEWSRKWYGNYQEAQVARAWQMALGQAGDAQALFPLTDVLRDTTEAMVWRATAATFLGRIGDARAVPALLDGMRDAHPMVRVRSAMSLGKIGDLRALPGLLPALGDTILPVRIFAAFALMDLGYLPDGLEDGDRLRKALAEHAEMVGGVQADDPGLRESLGMVYEWQGRYAAAEHEARLVERLDPRHPDTAVNLARIRENRRAFEAAEAMLTQAVREDSADVVRRARLGVFYGQNGNYGRATALLGAVAEGVREAAVYAAWGEACRGAGDRVGAADAYRQALEADPAQVTALCGLAHLAFASGEPPQACGAPGDSASVLAWCRLGAAHAVAGRYGAAQTAYGRALEMEAEAVAAREGDRLAGLSRAGARALSAAADQAEEAGMTAYRDGNLEAATQAFESAVALNPNQMASRVMLALILSDRGELARAEGRLRQMLFLSPGYSPAYAGLGTIYQEREQFGKAMQTYRQVLALDPEASAVEIYMGQVYAIQGKQDSARAVLKRVLARDPGNLPAQEMLRHVERGG